jgi:hypothetical protein
LPELKNKQNYFNKLRLCCTKLSKSWDAVARQALPSKILKWFSMYYTCEVVFHKKEKLGHLLFLKKPGPATRNMF